MRRITPRTLGGRAIAVWEAELAAAGARRLTRGAREAIAIVSWDLDNTLVDSGSLLRIGRTLDEAISEASPVPNMLRLVEELRGIDGWLHVVLTARPRRLATATSAWLERNGLGGATAGVMYVPRAELKVRIWRRLSAAAPLVVVDDLGYGHEHAEPSVHTDLVARVQAVATAYIGAAAISSIAADADAVATAAGSVRGAVASLARSSRDRDHHYRRRSRRERR